MPYRLQPRCS